MFALSFSEEIESLADELQLKLFRTSVKDNKYVEDGNCKHFNDVNVAV